MGAEILIQHGSTIQYPAVVEGAKLTLERKGTPGKLTFTVVKDSKLNFQEGDPVKLTLDGTPMFYGFVFIKSRDKDGTIDVTAYDQLRYLKNKDTITEEGLKAPDLLKRIATDFRLNLGTVEDTGYTMETVVEENQTLFDMIQNALDETLLNTGKLYVLYDDVGSLIYNNEKTGKRELYVAQDGEKINQWGVLQYFEEIQTATGAAAKAEAMLAHYDRKTRKLTIKNAFARPDIRAGSAVMVSLNLGDIIANQYLMAEKVVFTFKEDENMMDLTLVGGEFVA